MQDETMRLILELGGQAAVKQMADSVVDLEAKIKALATEWTNGTLATDKYLAKSKALEAQLEQSKGALGQLKGKGGVSGNGLLGISYAVQDFTSQLGTRGLTGALGAVQNNIPQILVGLGAGPGLAGVISVISVGVGMLLPQIEKLAEYFGTHATKTEAEHMKELGDNTKRTAEETKTLNKYKKDQAEAQKILDSQTKAQQEEQAAFEQLLLGKGEAVQKGIARGVARSPMAAQMTPAERDQLAKRRLLEQEEIDFGKSDADKAETRKETSRIRGEIQKRLDAANMETAFGMMGRLPTDAHTQNQIGAMALARPHDFPTDFSTGLANTRLGIDPFKQAQAMFKKENAFQGEREKSIKGQEKFDKSVRDAEEKDRENTAKIDKENDEKKQKAAKQISKDQQKQAEERAKRLEDTQKRLGPEFLARAEAALMDGATRQDIREHARAQLEAGGMSKMQAMAGANQLPGALMNDIGQKLHQPGMMKGQAGQMQLFEMLQQIINMQGQGFAMTNEQSQQIKAGIRRNGSALNTTRTNQSNGTF